MLSLFLKKTPKRGMVQSDEMCMLPFKNNFIEIGFTYHKVHQLKMCDSMFSNILTGLYNQT